MAFTLPSAVSVLRSKPFSTTLVFSAHTEVSSGAVTVTLSLRALLMLAVAESLASGQVVVASGAVTVSVTVVAPGGMGSHVTRYTRLVVAVLPGVGKVSTTAHIKGICTSRVRHTGRCDQHAYTVPTRLACWHVILVHCPNPVTGT